VSLLACAKIRPSVFVCFNPRLTPETRQMTFYSNPYPSSFSLHRIHTGISYVESILAPL
jgi:hypothetical protein